MSTMIGTETRRAKPDDENPPIDLIATLFDDGSAIIRAKDLDTEEVFGEVALTPAEYKQVTFVEPPEDAKWKRTYSLKGRGKKTTFMEDKSTIEMRIIVEWMIAGYPDNAKRL